MKYGAIRITPSRNCTYSKGDIHLAPAWGSNPAGPYPYVVLTFLSSPNLYLT